MGGSDQASSDMLRALLACALVATVLSAPTWTSQLAEMTHTTMLSSEMTEVSSCNCANCYGHYDYHRHTKHTAATCRDACAADSNCQAALFDESFQLAGETAHTGPKCWFYNANVNAQSGGDSKYTCFNKGTPTSSEITIAAINASSASCDGCTSGGTCDPRGPNRLISPCDATVCATTWGCGGSCTADVLTVNSNGQGEWCSRGGSSASDGGQWLDLDLGSSKTLTKVELWSGAASNRFPQTMAVLTGGSTGDGSTGGGAGCFDKHSSLTATSGDWSQVAGPYTIGDGTSLTGCASARTAAGTNTQADSNKCDVDVSGVSATQYIRLHFSGTAGDDSYMELRAIKV